MHAMAPTLTSTASTMAATLTGCWVGRVEATLQRQRRTSTVCGGRWGSGTRGSRARARVRRRWAAALQSTRLPHTEPGALGTQLQSLRLGVASGGIVWKRGEGGEWM